MNSPNLLSSDEAFDFSSDDSFKDPDFQQSTSNARKHKSGNESFHIEEKKIKGETKFIFNNDFFQLAKQVSYGYVTYINNICQYVIYICLHAYPSYPILRWLIQKQIR